MSIVYLMLSRRLQRMLGAMIVHPDREFGANELISIGGSGVGAGRNFIKDLDVPKPVAVQ
ncbi:hypothetical protein [Rhizobium leguminosarum]|uniref:hypothetical protein n=1 Tax=Rhizobium leguminosarum TaxID=384 RepID=UPI00103D5F04|nr:hypothetical protein [Rhizobium leguminosarum]TBZ99512.1 hypothetical protein E0H63_25360 [Rhizobium leguminosarum bv. viciae]